jgi:hypothetical protein
VDHGAIFSINHPTVSCAGCSWEHTIPDGVAGIEIWNRALGPQEDAIAIWDRLLRQGHRITGVGSSDWHGPPAPIDSASVRVFARELSVPAILDGLRSGRVVVVRDAATPMPLFTAAAGGETAVVGDTLTVRDGQPVDFEVTAPGLAGGRAEVRWNGERSGFVALDAGGRARFSRSGPAGYALAHLRAADGSTLAVTNPIYLTVR